MKTTKYIFFALATLGLATSCMDSDWSAPDTETGLAAYGNQYIAETNVKTIAEVKALYSNEITNNSLRQVKDPMQIKGVVVGNDEGGNIYNAIYVQDQTGAIAISISQSGLYGPFSVGQCVLIELKDLYVGGYGKQPQIGTTYTNPNKEDATPQVGRMSRYIWQQHYKLIPPISGLTVLPVEVKWNFNTLDIAQDCGKLITLKGVELTDADGTAAFAPSDGSVSLTANSANRNIKGLSDVVLRTSTYADFANQVLPTGRVDITGVATRYNDTWQILMRTANDICPTTLADNDVPPVFEPTGNGTASSPYNVAGIVQATQDLASGSTTSAEYYVTGYICKVGEYRSQYGSISYFISDDKYGNSGSFYVYGGLGLGKAKFSSADDLKAGDKVTICGKVTNYNGTIEFQSNNYIVPQKAEPKGTGTLTDPYNVAAAQDLINSLGADVTSETIYVKGYISDLGSGVSTQYWNAQFYISDTAESTPDKLLVYRTNYLGDQPFTSADQIKAGDEVIMCGKVINYKGTTPEFTTGTYIYSLNGKTE